MYPHGSPIDFYTQFSFIFKSPLLQNKRKVNKDDRVISNEMNMSQDGRVIPNEGGTGINKNI